MKVALIAPEGMLNWTKHGDMHFILTNVAKKRRLWMFFKGEKKYKMLDNGVYETNFPLDPERLVRIAKLVRADEVVAPDYLMRKRETITATKEFVECYRQKGLKICAVPQGRDPVDFIDAYRKMKRLPVDVIAIPIWLQKLFRARPAVVGYLQKHKIWDETKEHHLLGLDEYGELYAYEKNILRSVDTSLPFSLTNSQIWETFYYVPHRRIDMDRGPFTKMQERMLIRHIRELKKVAKRA